MEFYLGTHKPNHLERTAVPLFVSRRTLAPRRRLPRALGPWALDSGGFSELSLFGEWRTSAMQYVSEVRRFKQEVGHLSWAAAQDWMCEPFILAKTGMTLRYHQQQTITNYVLLRSLASDLPFVPVLQGWEEDDYLRHLDDYAEAGIDLRSLPLVGLGSVCRRQGTGQIEGLIRRLHEEGLKLHLFGFKLKGLRTAAPFATSSDSMAWSFEARRGAPLPECTHPTCQNCLRYALKWREKVLRVITSASANVQPTLFHGGDDESL